MLNELTQVENGSTRASWAGTTESAWSQTISETGRELTSPEVQLFRGRDVTTKRLSNGVESAPSRSEISS